MPTSAIILEKKLSKLSSDIPDLKNILSLSLIDSTQYDLTAATLMSFCFDNDVRMVTTLPDGTVTFDSNVGELNTYANYKAKLINENHNSRISILTALLSNSGIGTEQKFSTSTNLLEFAIAKRLGSSSKDSDFVARLSQDVDSIDISDEDKEYGTVIIKTNQNNSIKNVKRKSFKDVVSEQSQSNKIENQNIRQIETISALEKIVEKIPDGSVKDSWVKVNEVNREKLTIKNPSY
jgi:hypothetical protein